VKASLLGRWLAFGALLSVAGLGACGGGGSSVGVPTTALQPPSNGSVAIGSLDILHPASSTAVTITSRIPAGTTTDIQDRATVALGAGSNTGATVSDSASHAFAGNLFRSTSAAKRSTSAVAVNSPNDLSYHGGVVLGSAVSHNIFVNCDQTCRNNVNFNPGPFINALNNDQYITLLYQYMTSPGVVDSTPVTGSFPKGLGADKVVTYASPRPSSTNPYYGQQAIWFLVLNAAGGLGQPDTGLGGGGYGHIYHVYLPQNVDTCFEPNGVPTSSCYSPDRGSTFVFCAYHGSVTFLNNQSQQRQTYLYTVEPYQDVNGCRNAVYNQGTLPNAASPTVNPADPGYSTLSHELFETISDPLLNAWYNNFSGGNEIGDICAEFDNFVTLSNHPYVLQSEYSDLNHECVSANLTSPAQTPQSAKRSH
jgi:hypothetical protein